MKLISNYGKIKKFLSKDATYSVLTPIILSVYGFLFLTFINRISSIEEVNEFLLFKQTAIYIVAFPDLISIPLLNLNSRFWNFTKIIIAKIIILILVVLIFNQWNLLILILASCLTIYGGLNIYFIHQNQYKKLFYAHLLGTLIAIPCIISSNYYFDLNPLLLFGISNLFISFFLVFYLFFFDRDKKKMNNTNEKVDFHKIFLLLVSSIILPLLINQFILDLKIIFKNDLYFLEYYFMISSVFATIIISPQINLIFTQKYNPNSKQNFIIFFLWIISSIVFLFLLKYINDQDTDYIKLSFIIFLLSDAIRMIIFIKSRYFILLKKFHILLIFEIIAYVITLIVLKLTQSLLTYLLVPLISILMVVIFKKLWTEKKY